MSRRSPPGRSLRQSDEREREVSGIRTWTWRCCCSRRTHPTGQRRYGFVLSVASSFASPNATRYSALDRKPRDRPERTAPSVRSADVNPTGRYRTQVGNRRPCRGSVDAEHRDRNSSHTVRASSIRLKPAHSRTTSPIRGHLLHAECTSRELRRRHGHQQGLPFQRHRTKTPREYPGGGAPERTHRGAPAPGSGRAGGPKTRGRARACSRRDTRTTAATSDRSAPRSGPDSPLLPAWRALPRAAGARAAGGGTPRPSAGDCDWPGSRSSGCGGSRSPLRRRC